MNQSIRYYIKVDNKYKIKKQNNEENKLFSMV